MLDLRKGLTLLELLLTLAIIAVVSAVIVIALNPVELLRETRDATRLADINTVHRSIRILIADKPATALGTTNQVSISIPDPNNVTPGTRTPGTENACGGITDLPSLSAGWVYDCVGSADLGKADGNGWIPVPFQDFSSGALFSNLPIDPINSVASGLYYTYVTGNGVSILTGALESQKYLKGVALLDGGTDASRAEVGRDLKLWADASGLLAYWKFDEGGTSNAARAHLKGVGAALNFGVGGSNTSYAAMWASGVPGKVGGALGFDGADDYAITGMPVNSVTAQATIHGWFYWTAGATSLFADNVATPNWNLGFSSAGNLLFRAGGGIVFNTGQPVASLQGAWHHYAFTKSGANVKYFIDGVEVFSGTGASSIGNAPAWRFMRHGGSNLYIAGKVDDMRVYNRPLTALEVQTYYNATQ